MYDVDNGGANYELVKEKFIKETKSIKYPTVYLEVGGVVQYESKSTDYNDLRATEKSAYQYTSKTDKDVDFLVVLSLRYNSRAEGIIGICRTLFVCIVLGIGSIFFTSDANKLVLNPIERMLEKVRFIAKNPLAAATDEVDTAGMMSLMHK